MKLRICSLSAGIRTQRVGNPSSCAMEGGTGTGSPVASTTASPNFAGCAVVISHDRWFLDRICTHILAFEGESQVYYFEGNYTEYEENKKKRLGNDTPKRIRYKKLVK